MYFRLITYVQMPVYAFFCVYFTVSSNDTAVRRAGIIMACSLTFHRLTLFWCCFLALLLTYVPTTYHSLFVSINVVIGKPFRHGLMGWRYGVFNKWELRQKVKRKWTTKEITTTKSGQDYKTWISSRELINNFIKDLRLRKNLIVSNFIVDSALVYFQADLRPETITRTRRSPKFWFSKR